MEINVVYIYDRDGTLIAEYPVTKSYYACCTPSRRPFTMNALADNMGLTIELPEKTDLNVTEEFGQLERVEVGQLQEVEV